MDCAVHNLSQRARCSSSTAAALDEVVPLGWLRLKLVNAVTATHMGGSVELGFPPTAPCTVAALALDGAARGAAHAAHGRRAARRPRRARRRLRVGGTHVFGNG